MERPSCSIGDCCNPVKYNGYNVDGTRRYHKMCSQHCKNKYKDSWKPEVWPQKTYGEYLKLPYCEYCGFTAEHTCQLDVDHKDGNHQNNSLDNLQTLCANCHRLKTWKHKDWL